MYKELLLFPETLKGQVIYPDVARKMVAQACDQLPIDPAIFGRDAHGKPLTGRMGDDRKGEGFGEPPAIVFDGGKGFIRLYGVGRRGSAVLTEQAMVVYLALCKHLGGPIRMEFNEGITALQMSKPILYSMRRMVITKNPAKLSHFFRVSAMERSEEIKQEILRGLIGSARWHDQADDEAGADGVPLEARIPSETSLLLDVLEGESVPIEIKPGVPGAAFKNLTFCTNLDLTGPWSVGKLRSRGYGLIRRRIER